MKEQFWRLFFDYKVAYYYYQGYCRSSAHKKRITSIVLTLCSMTFIGSWYFSQTVPLLWAVLTLLCQIVSVLQPFFPYDLQVTAANYICTDLNALTREMEYTWHSLEFNDKPDEIKDLIHEYQEKYDQIENRFAKSDTFPEDMEIHEKAEKDATAYFRRFENVTQ